MILVDTGPLVALFDPRDADHARVAAALEKITQPLKTTTPVLTEAFHLLDPASAGASALRAFLRAGGLSLWFMNEDAVGRAFDLMDRYQDRPMDFADASLVVAAERLRALTIFTLDRSDFAVYRATIGRAQRAFRVINVR